MINFVKTIYFFYTCGKIINVYICLNSGKVRVLSLCIIMDNNTFSQGVAPGGLREKTEIKLLICYLLKKLKRSLTRTQINEILQEYRIANYFEVNTAISELVSADQLISNIDNGDELITLTARAELDIGLLERDLPRSVKEKTLKSAHMILQRERIEKESIVEVKALDHGYHVTFTVNDMDTELLKLTVYVADEDQIEISKRNFYNKACEIYSGIISSLTVE